MTILAPTAIEGPQGRTRLITDRSVRTVHTAHRETDSRTAVTRGLAEYLEGLSAIGPAGRDIILKKTLHTWAVPEDPAEYPSVVVYTPSPVMYDASRFSPNPDPNQFVEGYGGKFYVVGYAETLVDVYAELWATDPVEQTTLVAAMEDAFNPVTWRSGLLLDLPHYFNCRASYELTSVQFLDNEAEAMQRKRRAVFVLKAQVPLAKLIRFPDAKPKPRLDEVGPNVIVEAEVAEG